jgi:hypothetical protein
MLLNCTIANNTVSSSDRTGSQLYTGQEFTGGTGTATIQIRNTIVSGDGSRPNVFADVSGTFVSQGHNLSNDDGGGFLAGSGDLINTDPMLGPLQDNGGRTQTMALLVGSPAFGAGDPTGAPDFDQRGPGFPRIVGGTIDIGAFELQPAPSVANVQINDGSAQRSMITSLTVTFNGVVWLEPGALQLQGPGGLVPLDVASCVVRNQTMAVITFTGPDIIGSSLADGDYTLRVLADYVHDASGQVLTADSVTHFFRLFGDSNGNGVIDFEDLRQIASTFGKRAGESGYLAYFDYYGDGRVDFDDLAQLLRRLGRRV